MAFHNGFMTFGWNCVQAKQQLLVVGPDQMLNCNAKLLPEIQHLTDCEEQKNETNKVVYKLEKSPWHENRKNEIDV